MVPDIVISGSSCSLVVDDVSRRSVVELLYQAPESARFTKPRVAEDSAFVLPALVMEHFVRWRLICKLLFRWDEWHNGTFRNDVSPTSGRKLRVSVVKSSGQLDQTWSSATGWKASG